MDDTPIGDLSAALQQAAQLLTTDPALAERQAQEILEAAPGDPRALLVAGMGRRRRGDLEGARSIFEPLARAQPRSAQTHHELGMALAGLGRSDDALAAFRQAVALSPGFVDARFDLAVLLYRQQRPAEALPHLEGLLAAKPREPNYRNLMAACLVPVGDYGRAIDIYRALLAEFPGQPRVWLNLGHVLRIAGRLEEAIAAYNRCLGIAAGLGEAYWSLANLKTVPFTPEQEVAMNAQMARIDLAAEDRLYLCYALGKALEDRGEFAKSFRHYAEGARLRRAEAPHDADENHDQMLRSKTLFSEAFFAERAGGGSSAPDPIFIVGLPRAGSTLIEQILTSHSAVEGATELTDIPALARRLGRPDSRVEGPRYPEVLAYLDNATWAALGEEYIQRTRIHRKAGRRYFIDKMPNNLHHIGLIQLILPKAKIIDARRAPMASCFSAFKQLFARGHAFSYDLTDLGLYYRDYVELMAHFDTVLPGRICRVIYEDMVEDTEGQVRRLLDYCGLPFEEACLRFHENDRPVRTASSEQVRRPIFREGLEQWRNYEPWLGPLAAALGPELAAAERPRS